VSVPPSPHFHLPSTGQSHRASVPAKANEWTDRHAWVRATSEIMHFQSVITATIIASVLSDFRISNHLSPVHRLSKKIEIPTERHFLRHVCGVLWEGDTGRFNLHTFFNFWTTASLWKTCPKLTKYTVETRSRINIRAPTIASDILTLSKHTLTKTVTIKLRPKKPERQTSTRLFQSEIWSSRKAAGP